MHVIKPRVSTGRDRPLQRIHRSTTKISIMNARSNLFSVCPISPVLRYNYRTETRQVFANLIGQIRCRALTMRRCPSRSCSHPSGYSRHTTNIVLPVRLHRSLWFWFFTVNFDCPACACSADSWRLLWHGGDVGLRTTNITKDL